MGLGAFPERNQVGVLRRVVANGRRVTELQDAPLVARRENGTGEGICSGSDTREGQRRARSAMRRLILLIAVIANVIDSVAKFFQGNLDLSAGRVFRLGPGNGLAFPEIAAVIPPEAGPVSIPHRIVPGNHGVVDNGRLIGCLA